MLIVPGPDPLTQPYWDGVAQGELRLANARPGFLAELRFDALP